MPPQVPCAAQEMVGFTLTRPITGMPAVKQADRGGQTRREQRVAGGTRYAHDVWGTHMSKNPIGIAALAALLAATLTGCTEQETVSSDQPQEKGSPETTADIATYGSLGAFSATTIDGATFTDADVAAKDVTVINFWQTTCPPCIEELPAIQALAQRLPDNVQILTMCFDGSGKREAAQKVLDKAGWTGTTLVSATDGLLGLARTVEYTPTTVFLASDGTLVWGSIVGSPSNLEKAYLEGINATLAWQGKDAVVLADAQ